MAAAKRRTAVELDRLVGEGDLPACLSAPLACVPDCTPDCGIARLSACLLSRPGKLAGSLFHCCSSVAALARSLSLARLLSRSLSRLLPLRARSICVIDRDPQRACGSSTTRRPRSLTFSLSCSLARSVSLCPFSLSLFLLPDSLSVHPV
jgi:hypothetical protein